MRAEDIEDRKTLQAWLTDRPRADALAIAHRAALRVLPVWGAAMEEDWARKGEVTALPLLRCNLISAVAALVPTADITDAAARATATAARSAAFATTTVDAHAVADARAAAFASADTDVRAATDARAAFTSARAAARAATTADAWDAIRADAQALEAGNNPLFDDIWHFENPEFFTPATAAMVSIWKNDPPARWTFWRRWWDAAVNGQPLDPQLQLAIVQGVDDDTWQDPDKTAARIAEIEAGFVPKLSDAAFADFRFDDVHHWMVLVDFDDDLAHLRDPEVIRAFHEDCEDLRDQLQDFIDFAGDAIAGDGNRAVAMVTSADKLLRELQRADGADRLRARRFVQLGQYTELRAAIEADRKRVGEINAKALDDALDAFRALCRKHLGPVLRRMEPLDGFDLGHHDPEDLLGLLSDVVARLKSAQIEGLKPLDPDAQAAFDDMVDALKDLRTQLAEAQSEERRSYLRERFTRGYVGAFATVKRLTERMTPYAEGTTNAVDGAIRNQGRFKKFSELVEWLSQFLT
ncbi:hypothetical protein [Aestuariicoccus sp. MJ-SS9]|uniref:hypothetical protein n=1 Tax=Aestuariicoccus sp. MJ-SS9 TaxID=3079855 RepID=UPI002908E180|nr:hypothetical protein [Aestuariicoccus sp. MJ-SS9]MDU8909905.1 hypothetical protein [Aestuariicoccus sp. MJ-SS9]